MKKLPAGRQHIQDTLTAECIALLFPTEKTVRPYAVATPDVSKLNHGEQKLKMLAKETAEEHVWEGATGKV